VPAPKIQGGATAPSVVSIVGSTKALEASRKIAIYISPEDNGAALARISARDEWHTELRR